MATATQQSPPDIRSLQRVASIPVVHDALSTVLTTLSSNAVTRYPYVYAEALAQTAYRLSTPIQVHLLPVITTADGFANKGLDIVQSYVPYPFETPTEKILGDIKSNRDHAYGVANKTLDDNIRTPAAGIMQDIDQRLAPLVDRFQDVVSRLNSNASSPASSSKSLDCSASEFQYQRAYRISMGLKDQVVTLSTDQLRQMQEHNTLVQHATETAYNVSGLLGSARSTAQSRLSSLSANAQSLSSILITDLESAQSSVSSTIHSLPAQFQTSLHEVQSMLGSASTELRAALGDARSIAQEKEVPLRDRMVKLAGVLQSRVQPLLEHAAAKVQSTLRAGEKNAAPAKDIPNSDERIPSLTVAQ